MACCLLNHSLISPHHCSCAALLLCQRHTIPYTNHNLHTTNTTTSRTHPHSRTPFQLSRGQTGCGAAHTRHTIVAIHLLSCCCCQLQDEVTAAQSTTIAIHRQSTSMMATHPHSTQLTALTQTTVATPGKHCSTSQEI